MSASVAPVAGAPARTGQMGPGYLALVLLFCLTWSSAFPAAKMAIAVSPPALFLGVRFTVAGLLLLGWAALRGDLRGRMPWGRLAVLGLLNQACYQGLAWEGMRTTSAGLATIITSLNPILISVIAAPLLGEALGMRRIAGLLLGMAGAVFVVRNRIALGEDPLGVAFICGSLVAAVAGTLYFKKADLQVSLVTAVGGQQFFAGLIALTVGLLTESPARIIPSPQLALTMLWFVVIVSVGGMLVWFQLLRKGSASAASSLHFLIPPLGLVMSWAALGERINPTDLLGIIPVAAGIWLVTRGPVRK